MQVGPMKTKAHMALTTSTLAGLAGLGPARVEEANLTLEHGTKAC